MKKGKILGLLLVTSIIGCSCIFIKYGYSKVAQASSEDIKELDYKECSTESESSLQIDKYEKIQSSDWISDSEVVVLTKKEEYKASHELLKKSIKYCSIYNLNTKESKDFKDVNIEKFFGVSQDKQYVLYSEPTDIQKSENGELYKNIEPWDDIHPNMKILNLSTGQITDLVTENNNSEAQYVWIDGNNILINYSDKWAVVDIGGKVMEQGSYNSDSEVYSNITDASDIKCSDNGLEGKLYYSQRNRGKEGANILCMDMKTKETTSIISEKNISSAFKKGSSIVVPYYEYNGEVKYKNEIFGAYILDETGNKLQDMKFSKDIDAGAYTISPDGSKIAYVENKTVKAESVDVSTNKSYGVLKVLDVNTGKIKEIINQYDLEDKNTEDISNDYFITKVQDENSNEKDHKVCCKHSISDVSWDKSGNSLLFTYCNSVVDSKYDSYIVSFD